MSVTATIAINGAEVHTIAVEGGADLKTLLHNIETVKADVNRVLTEKIDEEKAAGNGMSCEHTSLLVHIGSYRCPNARKLLASFNSVDGHFAFSLQLRQQRRRLRDQTVWIFDLLT